MTGATGFVGRHVVAVKVLADNLEYVREGRGVGLGGLPTYQELEGLTEYFVQEEIM